MEKNVTLSASNQTEVNFQNIVSSLHVFASKVAFGATVPVEWLRKYYSKVCEKELTVRQTIDLVSVQLAFIATVFPADATWTARVGCGVWLAVALLRCKKFLA